jgi:broad specificity phosphatase PhoE
MRILEVRRHSMRAKPGGHLTQAGVTLARRAGEGLGPFARVITSPLPRAFETAIAMGFAVDEQVDWLETYGQAVEDEIPWPATFESYARVMQAGWAATSFALKQSAHWRDIARGLSDDESALMVSHGGVIELGAIGCLRDGGVKVDFSEWGDHLDFCEGVRLTFVDDICVGGEVLRVPQTV